MENRECNIQGGGVTLPPVAVLAGLVEELGQARQGVQALSVHHAHRRHPDLCYQAAVTQQAAGTLYTYSM